VVAGLEETAARLIEEGATGTTVLTLVTVAAGDEAAGLDAALTDEAGALEATAGLETAFTDVAGALETAAGLETALGDEAAGLEEAA